LQFVEIDGLAHEVVGTELERGFDVVELGSAVIMMTARASPFFLIDRALRCR